MKEFSLSKKVVLISGANGLIGTEISDALASANASIVLLDNCPIKTLIKLESKLKNSKKKKPPSFSTKPRDS